MKEPSIAVQILFALGVYHAAHKKLHHVRRPLAHFSKKGPGRKHQQGNRA